MRESYEQRRARIIKRGFEDGSPGPIFMSAADYLAQEDPPTSEELLAELAPNDWSPAAFVDSARELLREHGLSGRVYVAGEQPPTLQRDPHFKYWPQYSEGAERAAAGEKIIISAVTENDRVIGFGIAVRGDSDSNIEIVNVEGFSGRSSGLERKLSTCEQEFTVGIGHAVVDLLLPALCRPIHADATNASSRYILKSLGFVSTGDSNPCLLVLK
jgi:hypothetical protein